jgi:hypothetical protein
MKRVGMIACMALTLCTSPQSARAHGCELFWAIPLALGVGAAIGSAFAPHPTYVYPPPTYVYSPPVYSYSYPPPSHSSAPATTYGQAQPTYAQRFYPPTTTQIVQAPRSVPAQQVVWTPRTTGVGHWVPDPEPYAYLPQKAPATMAIASKVNSQATPLSGSPGNVPVLAVSR